MVREKMVPSRSSTRWRDLNKPFRAFPEGHGLGKLHAARRRNGPAITESKTDPTRRAGADLPREYHARNLQPGPDTAGVVQLHGVSRQRDDPSCSSDRIGLHIHPGESAVTESAAALAASWRTHDDSIVPRSMRRSRRKSRRTS